MAVACGGTEEKPKLERWGLSIWQSGTAISVPVLWAYESIDLSQVDAYGDWVLPQRVEAGRKPNHVPTFLQINNGAFVLHRFVGLNWSSPTEEELAKGKTAICTVSDEVFGGLTTTFIYHRFKSPFSHQDLANAALSGAKDVIWRERTCGEGVAKSEAIQSKSSEGGSTSDGDSTPKATSAPQVENYSGCKGLEDLIPKLAFSGTVTISYYQVVQIGRDNLCGDIIKEVNKPENLKD